MVIFAFFLDTDRISGCLDRSLHNYYNYVSGLKTKFIRDTSWKVTVSKFRFNNLTACPGGDRGILTRMVIAGRQFGQVEKVIRRLYGSSR